MEIIKKSTDLKVYKEAFQVAMKIFEISKSFPKEEIYSLTDQIRRSSRSICANISEAFRKRHYEKNFVLKIIECESEADETQTWLMFAYHCQYLAQAQYDELMESYDRIIGLLVRMRNTPEKWH